MSEALLKKKIRAIPDFPKKGILFRDITPLLLDPKSFSYCIDSFSKISKRKIDYVISIESRGFIFGSALAHALKAGFVPVRKAGKLPHKTFKASCELEYGEAVLEIHKDSMKKGKRAVIVDDVLATGGTAEAAASLARKCGVQVDGAYFLIELAGLKGRARLKNLPVHTLVRYS